MQDEAQSQSSQDPLAQPVELPGDETPPQAPGPQKKPRKLLKILLVIIILALAAGATWKFIFAKENNPQAPEQTQNTPAPAPEQASSDVPPAGEMKTYDNGLLRITLTHPDTWKVTEESGGVRIESAAFDYETLSGLTEGNFKIYIRKGARQEDSKYIGQGVVIRPTEKLKYTNPTAAQRKETNLSFFGYGDQTNFAYFIITGNFELDPGDTLGPGYGKEADAYIIAGGYSEVSLEDDLAFNTVSTDGFDKTEAYKQAINIIESLQLR